MQAVSNPVEGKPYAWLAALASGGKGAHSNPVHSYAGSISGRFPPLHPLSIFG